MSTARRLGVFSALLAPLLAAAVVLVQQGGDAPPSLPRRGASHIEPTSAPSDPSLRARVAALARGAVRRQRRAEARREDPSSEPPPPKRRPRGAGARIERSARRFWAAFSRYQLGRLSPGVERDLRETATGRFARELLRAPPRAPLGGVPRQVQRPAGLDLVPRRYRGGGLVGAELVGRLIGGRQRAPLAFELERGREGWRVAALSR